MILVVSLREQQTANEAKPRLDQGQDGLEGQLLNTAASDALKAKALQTLGTLPPFSPVLNKLLASLADENVSFAELSDWIEKDTVIAGNILHLVNSALYARRGTVNSVRHALSLLGVNKLRNAVLGMSITKMWRHVRTPSSWSMARFNMHSAATAMLSDLIAQTAPVEYPEGAFVAGLLHDVGRLLIAIGLPHQHEEIIALHERDLAPRIECEHRVLGFTHTDLSAAALAVWNLPQPIQAAVQHHHHLPTKPESDLHPLSSVLAASNAYVNSMGVSLLPEPGSPRGNPMVLDPLQLTPQAQADILQQFKTEFETMSPFFH
jgi:HD-like signal output (HDOD) protein